MEKIFLDLYISCNGDKEKMKELVMNYFESGELLFKHFPVQEGKEKREIEEEREEKQEVKQEA